MAPPELKQSKQIPRSGGTKGNSRQQLGYHTGNDQMRSTMPPDYGTPNPRDIRSAMPPDYGTQNQRDMTNGQSRDDGEMEKKRKTSPYCAARNMAIEMFVFTIVPTVYCAVKAFVGHHFIRIDGSTKGQCLEMQTQSQSADRWLTATAPFVVTSFYFLGASFWYFARSMRAGDNALVTKVRELRERSWVSRKTGFSKAMKKSSEARKTANMKLQDMKEFEQMGPVRR